MSDNLPVKTTPQDLLSIAVQGNADLDKIEKLMDLQDRWEKNEARKAFTVAMAEFKKNPPTIFKDKTVSYEQQSGTTEFKHPSLHNVVDTISKDLSKHGLSAGWKTDQDKEYGIKVTCSLTHVQGHSESTSLCAGPDTSGKKNQIQAIASTVSYLERYTLLAITGLSSKEMDDDGNNSEPKDMITDEQNANINTLQKDLKTKDVEFDAWIYKRFNVPSADKLTKTDANKALMIMNAQLEEKNAGNN